MIHLKEDGDGDINLWMRSRRKLFHYGRRRLLDETNQISGIENQNLKQGETFYTRVDVPNIVTVDEKVYILPNFEVQTVQDTRGWWGGGIEVRREKRGVGAGVSVDGTSGLAIKLARAAGTFWIEKTTDRKTPIWKLWSAEIRRFILGLFWEIFVGVSNRRVA
ncbi:hypothetical protein DL98DRAFT_535091 [Cadophora sp. DSE1049]|nr:hypothetical protein DL98DRAFT_535091 [Cadophora sp. DSE1049]